MASLRESEIVAVIGAGTMGAGIAQVAACAGHPVLIYDIQPGAASAAVTRIEEAIQRLVDKRRMAEVDQRRILDNLGIAESLEQLAPAGLVVEVVLERLDVKQTVFAQLEYICPETTLFATNTSSISVTAIGKALRHPERLAGLHFFNPAPVMKLVEVISGLQTSHEVAQTLFLTAKKWGKEPVHAKSTPGFIVNRVARPFYAEALRAYQEGLASFSVIDSVLREAGGFRMGPFELMDLIGNDVNYAVTESVYNAFYQDRRFMPSLIQKEYVDAGRYGRKSGAGFYDYPAAANDAPPSEHRKKRIDTILVSGDLRAAQALVGLAEERGIRVQHAAGDQAYIQVGNCRLALSDGRTATQRCHQDGIENLVLFDLALDFRQARQVAIATSDQACREALEDAIAFFEALDKKVALLDDLPGLLVLRTLAMLVNEGSDAALQGVCTALAVDQAMKSGVNYPLGPLEWGQKVGLDYILGALNNLEASYGDGRYRSSLLLQRKVSANQLYYQPV